MHKPSKTIYKVFLSSTVNDLSAYRRNAREAILRFESLPIAMETFGAQSNDPVTVCQNYAKECDVIIVIVGHRYGWIPTKEDGGDGKKSITWLEVEAALSAKKSVLAFLVDPKYPWHEIKEQDSLVIANNDKEALKTFKRTKNLSAFRNFIEEEVKVIRDIFTTPEDLAAKIATSLGMWILNKTKKPFSTTEFGEYYRDHRTELLNENPEKETPTTRFNNNKSLPPRPLVFVGRVKLKQEVKRHIIAGGVTILKGEGGIGKTALAIEAAYYLLNSGKLSGGIAWINCEIGPSKDECFRQIAFSFFGSRLENESINGCIIRIITYMKRTGALIILDNFETISQDEGLVNWITTLRAPLRILITARRFSSDLTGHIITVAELSRKMAINLFLKRSKMAGLNIPTRRLGSPENSLIGRMCAIIGNLPLAIELIAVRAAYIPLERLFENVKSDLASIFSKGNSIRPNRHQNLFTCFQVSFVNLSSQARKLLLNTCILTGGLGAEVITIIMGKDNWDDYAIELMEASMWRLSGIRYTLHPLVRQFCLEKLGTDKLKAEQCVAEKVVSLAQKKGKLTEPPIEDKNAMIKALDWFEQEWPNLLNCADIAYKSKNWKSVGLLAASVFRFMLIRGHWDECEVLLNMALSGWRYQGELLGQGRTIQCLGIIYRRQGRWKEAETILKEGIRICRKAKDQFGESRNFHSLGITYLFEWKLKEAKETLNEAINIRREIGYNVGEGRTLIYLGIVCERQCKWSEAQKYLETSLDILQHYQERAYEGIALNSLGNIFTAQDNFMEAETCYRKSLMIRREVGDYLGEAETLKNCGICHSRQNQFFEAEKAYNHSLQIFKSLGDRIGEGTTLTSLAYIAKQQGNLTKAIEIGKLAVSILEETEDLRAFQEAISIVEKLQE